MLKRITLRIVALSLSFALGLGITELAFRILPLEGPHHRSTRVGGVGTGGYWQPDFRGRPRPSEKPSGTFRILVVGDSFTWGGGVHPEDVYPERLERRLSELESELDFEVVNWSRSGWNTHQEFSSVKRAIRWLEPNLVILGFVLNDAEPDSPTERRSMRQGLIRRSPQQGLSLLLHRRSRLYRMIWERLENTRQRRVFTAYYHSLYDSPGWERCQLALKQFRNRSLRHEVPLVMVIFPIFDSQLDASYPYVDLHRKVRRAAKEIGIQSLDLLRAYRGIDARWLAVTPFTDPHPNELAHRVAADRLVRYLIKQGLVPIRDEDPSEATPDQAQVDAVVVEVS